MATPLRFDCFEVDLAAGRVLKHGIRIHLREQSFRVLELLLSRPGDVVTREDLRRQLWPGDVFVDFENNLNAAVARLREAPGDSSEHPRFIETLPRRGYRFIAAVSGSPAARAAEAAKKVRLLVLPFVNASGDQEHVFARRYDGTSAEMFALQGRIAREIADRVGTEAGIRGMCDPAAGGHRATRMPTADVTAYNEDVQGLYHLDHMSVASKGHEKVSAHLESALARDPNFALAYEALAQMYWILGYVGFMPPRDAFAAGILHAVRALEIDNARAETHALVAQYRKQLDYDWPEIERGLAHAVKSNPASPLVRMLHAVGWFMPQGRLGEAIVELDRALEWDPLSYELHFWRTIMFSLAREADRVVAEARLLIELDPAAPKGSWLLGVALRRKGRPDEAVAALRSAVDLSNGAAVFLRWLGLILGAGGRTEEARNVLERLEVISGATYVPPASFAWVYLGLRDVDRAFEWLDRAVDGHDQLMMPIRSYVFFDPIRDDPRFAASLRKMNLEA
jgi:DNA-binding winged helix-turn-helix (wHTH) protein/Tfp pilus assembly protein PilF